MSRSPKERELVTTPPVNPRKVEVRPPRMGKDKTHTPVTPSEQPPTLSDLFNKDFPNTMKASDDAIGIQWKDTGGIIQIKRQLYLDFPSQE